MPQPRFHTLLVRLVKLFFQPVLMLLELSGILLQLLLCLLFVDDKTLLGIMLSTEDRA